MPHTPTTTSFPAKINSISAEENCDPPSVGPRQDGLQRTTQRLICKLSLGRPKPEKCDRFFFCDTFLAASPDTFLFFTEKSNLSSKPAGVHEGLGGPRWCWGRQRETF